MKLDLAAVEATAGGKEGTVIWAKRAEGRVARTNWSGAAGVGAAGAAIVWTSGAGAGVGAATFLTVIDFASGTGVAFLGDDAGATLALPAGVGLDAAATDLGAGAAAFVLAAGNLEVATAVFVLLGVLAAGGALGFGATGDTALALLTVLTAGLASTATVFLASGAFTTTALLAGAVLAGADFLAAAALAKVVFTGAATFFFGVVTSCLLAA